MSISDDAESSTHESRAGFKKETIASLIAIGITVVSLWLLCATFYSPSEFLEQRKDIMIVAISMVGMVTGYYFGRVPAEWRAQRAEIASEAAYDRLESAQSVIQSATVEVEAARAEMEVERTHRKTAEAKLAHTLGEVEAIGLALIEPAGERVFAEGTSTGDSTAWRAHQRLDSLCRLMTRT